MSSLKIPAKSSGERARAILMIGGVILYLTIFPVIFLYARHSVKVALARYQTQTEEIRNGSSNWSTSNIRAKTAPIGEGSKQSTAVLGAVRGRDPIDSTLGTESVASRRAARRISFESAYASYFRMTGTSPNDAGKLLDLLSAHSTFTSELMLRLGAEQFRNNISSVRQEVNEETATFDSQLTALLGSSRGLFEQFTQGIAARRSLEDLRALLASTSEQLQEQTDQALEQLLIATAPSANQVIVGGVAWKQLIWTDVFVDQALKILTPGQSRAFNYLYSNYLAQRGSMGIGSALGQPRQ